MTRMLPLILATVCSIYPSVAAQETYDLVLSRGHVMDPESGLDAVRDVGIRDGKIAAISESPLRGKESVNAAGLVVAPGFIDLHAHGQDEFSSRFQAQDGVTTALELETGVWPVAPWYASKEGKSHINYGATSGHIPARIFLKHGIETGHYSGDSKMRDLVTEKTDGSWAYAAATPDEQRRLTELLQRGLDEGALGLGLGVAYTPGATRGEIQRVFQLGADNKVVSFIHMRAAGPIEPGSVLEAMQEVVSGSLVTGASIHIVHITSMALGQLDECFTIFDAARARGLDLSTEVYPYTAGSTNLASALFAEGFQDRLGIAYSDLEWTLTGERLNAETFAEYRKRGGWVIIHMMHADNVRKAVARPDVVIASDGVPFVGGRAHPRGAGTFSRVLGHYVREEGALTLMDALRKMTLMPAQRLEASVPQMREKGRIRLGADADLVVFDPATVLDRATYEDPAQASAGIAQVIVGGTFIVRDGTLKEDAFPGKAIRREIR